MSKPLVIVIYAKSENKLRQEWVKCQSESPYDPRPKEMSQRKDIKKIYLLELFLDFGFNLILVFVSIREGQ